VPNPGQANRDGDKYGDACDLTGCHSACAIGCTRPNDITACTTQYYAGRWRNCRRCKKGFRPSGEKEGCIAGSPLASNCPGLFPAPEPVQCVLPPVCTNFKRRMIMSENNSGLNDRSAIEDSDGDRVRVDRALGGTSAVCACDGKNIITNDFPNYPNGCVYLDCINQYANGCTPGESLYCPE
jgi:hypothetical protein